ncbi:MAG: hypothetical protein J6M20_06875 [Clostridia bacterium]|nr:hypothetical protein [Clostridia bacterium]
MCKRKVLLLAAAICMIAILAAGGTLAYFVAEETAYNVITTAVLAMELREETSNGQPWPEKGVHQLVPGSTVDKIVTMANTGSVDFYVRASVNTAVASGTGDPLPFEHITLDYNTSDWTEKDGYFYYKQALLPGEETSPLFTTVAFSTTMGNEYMNARLEIGINAQAVQSKNNAEDVLSATGWPEQDKDGDQT